MLKCILDNRCQVMVWLSEKGMKKRRESAINSVNIIDRGTKKSGYSMIQRIL